MGCNDEVNLSQSLLLTKVHEHVTAMTYSTAKMSSMCCYKKAPFLSIHCLVVINLLVDYNAKHELHCLY